MGDRSNIKFNFGEAGSIYLYFHWAGTGIGSHLQTALKEAEQRWNDESYCTRYIVTKLTHELCGNELTGSGLSPYLVDNEYNILEVNFPTKEVKTLKKSGEVLKKWSFQNFCTQYIDFEEVMG